MAEGDNNRIKSDTSLCFKIQLSTIRPEKKAAQEHVISKSCHSDWLRINTTNFILGKCCNYVLFFSEAYNIKLFIGEKNSFHCQI